MKEYEILNLRHIAIQLIKCYIEDYIDDKEIDTLDIASLDLAVDLLEESFDASFNDTEFDTEIWSGMVINGIH